MSEPGPASGPPPRFQLEAQYAYALQRVAEAGGADTAYEHENFELKESSNMWKDAAQKLQKHISELGARSR